MKILFLLLLIVSCSHTSIVQKLQNQGQYIVSGCTIYDLEGKIIRSYPGLFCIFHEDGSYLSYDEKNLVLTKYDKDLKKLWSFNRHVHHEMKLTSSGDYLLNSSIVKKNIRYDEILLLSSHGKLIKHYSFYDHLKEIRRPKMDSPYRTNWEQNLKFEFEFTHLAASYEVPRDMKLDDKIFAPKGSYLLSLNSLGSGVYILDEKMERILDYRHLPVSRIFHDAQLYSPTELIYFYNTGVIHPELPKDFAKVVIYDVFKNKISKEFSGDFYALFGGGVQVLSSDLFLISDTDSAFNLEIKDKISKHEVHRLLKGRVVFYSLKEGIVHEVHFNQPMQQVKMWDLQSFLEKNIGL